MTSRESDEEMRRLLQARLQEWGLREAHPESRPGPVVTITREPGCGGESIAEQLCAELNLHLYDWELVEQIAKVEREHRRLVKKYFHADVRDSTHYHLVVNMALVQPGVIVNLVKTVLLAQTCDNQPEETTL
jgi:cytidylate kinase